MTGKFQKSWADFGGFKPRAALEYDCFVALAHGARCSVGDQLHPSGLLDDATYDLIGEVYASVAAKEPWCEGAKAVTEIAVVTPECIGGEDGRVDSSARGALRILQEAHHQFDVVDFDMPWEKYRLVILPDKITLSVPHAEKVRRFLAGGGSVIASYRSGLTPAGDRFALDSWGVEYRGELAYSPDYVEALGPLATGVRPTQHVMYDRGLQVRGVEAEMLARVWAPYFNRSWQHFSSHRHAPAHRPTDDPAVLRHGRTIYFAHPVFLSYGKHGSEALRLMIQNAIRLLLPDPLMMSNAPGTAHITMTRQEGYGRDVIHVLHYIPEARYSEIPLVVERIPLHDITLNMNRPEKPKRVYAAPENEELEWEHRDGRLIVQLPRVDGHAMVVIE